MSLQDKQPARDKKTKHVRKQRLDARVAVQEVNPLGYEHALKINNIMTETPGKPCHSVEGCVGKGVGKKVVTTQIHPSKR